MGQQPILTPSVSRATFQHCLLRRTKLILTLTIPSKDYRPLGPPSAAFLESTPERLHDQHLNRHSQNTGILPFPVSNFKHCLTFFSKFFSSFAHATCSLSVSRKYLALDETYHPLRAAIPNNPTRWAQLVHQRIWATYGDITLSVCLFQDN